MLYLASNKSDQAVEREIFEQFFFESNKIMIEEIGHFFDKIQMFEKFQNLLPSLDPARKSSGMMAQQVIAVHDVENSSNEKNNLSMMDEPKSEGSPISRKKPLTMMQQSALLMKQQQSSRTADNKGTGLDRESKRSEDTNKSPRKQIEKGVALSKQQMKTELELLLITMEEQKMQNRQIQ